MPAVSIVIPVRADTAALRCTLASNFGDAQVLVGATLEDQAELAPLRAAYPSVDFVYGPRGRAAQMNAAAARALGDWILFLHADTRLPDAWPHAIDAADRGGYVGGCFRLALDERCLAARLIALGVRLRVRLCGLPYGDQALFVRREIFHTTGGYTVMPIMEDVDFVRRLKRRGTIFHSPLLAVTSARRWRRDGWRRRSVGNVVLILLFYAGVSPFALARLDAIVRRDGT